MPFSVFYDFLFGIPCFAQGLSLLYGESNHRDQIPPGGRLSVFLLSVFSHPYPLLSGIIGLKMRSRSILIRGGAIMEPFYYYWSMWFLWILATFIFAKTKSRFYVSVFILTNMMASIHQITAYFTLNAAYVMFFVAAFVYAGSLGMHKRLRNIVIHLTAVAAYSFIFLLHYMILFGLS